jgi:hypothetical protein
MTTTPKNFEPSVSATGGDEEAWSNEEEATATCFCGSVRLVVVCMPSQWSVLTPMLILMPQPLRSPGLLDTFICNCKDCHKFTASMFTTAFVVADSYLKHVRGHGELKTYRHTRPSAMGNIVTNYFCSNCGTLMYRASTGFPGISALRVGTVDDHNLHNTKLKPRRELFVENRAGWLSDVDGVEKVVGSPEAFGTEA